MTRSRHSKTAPALLLVGAALLALPATALAHAPNEVDPETDFAEDIQGNVPGASVLEGRLMAPCCWMQTIDIHDSPVAMSMRHEVRRRLRNGESAETIQASFVERYGPKIMAVQNGSQLPNVFIGLALAMAGAGVAAAFMLGRWRKQSVATAGAASKVDDDAPRDKYDDKLDAELHQLDG